MSVILVLLAIAAVILVLSIAAAIVFPFLLAIAGAVAIYLITRTIVEHNHWKTYIFDGASGVAMVVILTIVIFLVI